MSIWTFDKAELTKKDRPGGPITDKSIVEDIFKIMQKDMQLLEKCQGIGILKVIEVIDLGKSQLAFDSEPIICSLQDSLEGFPNISWSRKRCTRDRFEVGGSIMEMEISRGICQVLEGLNQLHTLHNYVHINLTPESIVITSGGQWNICGFGFSLEFDSVGTNGSANPYFQKGPSGQMRIEPDLRYCGVEITEGGLSPPTIRYITPAQDIFSLGVSAFEAYRFSIKLAKRGRGHMSVVPPTMTPWTILVL